MGKGSVPGELELLVLLAVLRLGENAYGLNVRRELAVSSDRDVAIGAVYSALDRLERKGLVSSWLSEPTGKPGGRSRRCFQVEPAGREALSRSLRTIDKLRRGLRVRAGEEGSA
jgi:DNA-binding PadR family transcriptional regulator